MLSHHERVTAWIVAALTAAAGLLIHADPAQAVSQWSRKYGEPCSTCHAGFPRLTYYGERFKRNGYQDPDAAEPDGATRGKKPINAQLAIDTINNWFGARVNLDLVKVETKVNTIEGKSKARATIGNPNWLQFFVAGSLFENASIFIENEFEKDEFKFSWFWLGFHNLFDSPALNVLVGRVSPLDFTSYSNRLRITPAVRSNLPRIKSSNGAGDDSIDLSSSRPGIQYYGVHGPLVWFSGLSTGGTVPDPNQNFNGWAGLRLEVTEDMESAFEGSSISIHGLYGKDACTTASAAAFDAGTNDCRVQQTKNEFYRITPAVNLRWGRLDLQGMGVFGKDDNWNLSRTKMNSRFSGFNVVGQYKVTPSILPGLMVDWIDTDGPPSLDAHRRRVVTPFVRWFPRENFDVALYFDIDAQSKTAAHPVRKHRAFINLRAMF